MSFAKYARADVIAVKSSGAQIRHASLDKFATYEGDYRTEDGYLYVRVRAISSRVNKNHDGWPSEELSKAYRTFIGKPIFVDHHNHDPSRARGVIVDAQLHVDDEKTAALDPYYASAPANHKPATWVELLLEIDAKSFPKLAKAIINGDIDGVSMGANVERSVCSHCSNEARTPDEFCNHIRSKGAYHDFVDGQGVKTSKRSYEDCYDIGFFEISAVFDPADETALAIPGSLKHAKIAAEVNAEGMTKEAIGLDSIPTWFENAAWLAFAGGIAAANLQGMWQDWRAKHGDQPADPEQVAQQLKRIGPATGEGVETLAAPGQFYDQAQDPNRIASSKWHPPQQMRDGRTFHESEDGRWHVLEDEPGSVSVKDYAEEEWLDQQFTSADEAKAHCESLDRHDMGYMSSRTADRHNPPPQSEQTTAPDKVNTLRQEQVCPVCGSSMEDGICEVCNYEEPPEGFDNPDLEKAQEVDQEMRQDQAAGEQETEIAPPGQEAAPGAQPPLPSNGMPMQSSTTSSAAPSAVTGDTPDGMARTAADSKGGGRVRVNETAILPASRRATDKPKEAQTVEDHREPVESSFKGATDMSEHTHKIADGATANGGADVQADKRVEVDGVGGVMDNPLGGIEHQNVEKAHDETGPHTDTWSTMDGQTDAVSSDTFPAKGDGVTAADKTAGPAFPDHEPTQVDVTAPISDEVGDRTQTWSGTEGQADPTTPGDVFPKAEDGVKAAAAQGRNHALACVKLAETEIELGLIEASSKYERISELEDEALGAITARQDTLQSVRTAGLRKQAGAGKTAATRMPSMRGPRTASVNPTEHAAPADDDSIADSQIFG